MSYTGNATAGKPDPAVFLNAAKTLGVDPNSCLAFEDTLEGISAARSAGMDTVAIREKWSPELSEKIRRMSGTVVDNYLLLPEDLRVTALPHISTTTGSSC